MSTKTYLVKYREMPEILNYVCFRALLNMRVEFTAAVTRPEETYSDQLLISKTGGQFLITGKFCPPQTGHNVLEHRQGKNSWYFFIVRGFEECTIWVATEGHNCVLHSEEERTKLCKVNRMEEMRLSRE